jgi:hypothetical protein
MCLFERSNFFSSYQGQALALIGMKTIVCVYLDYETVFGMKTIVCVYLDYETVFGMKTIVCVVSPSVDQIHIYSSPSLIKYAWPSPD